MSTARKATELLHQRYKLVKDAREMYDAAEAEGRELNSEESERWDSLMDQADSLEERANKIQTDLARLEAAELAREDTRERLAQNGLDPDTAEERVERYRDVFWRYQTGGMDAIPDPEDRKLLLSEKRTIQGQTKGTNAQGGFLVPEDFRAELMVALKDFGGVREAARVITTATGRDLPWPRSDDTGNTAKLIGEATAISTSARVPFGSVTLGAYTYHSGPIKISMELDQDAELPIDEIVMDAMRIRFGRRWNTDMTLRSSTEAVAGPVGLIHDSTGAVALAGGAAAFNSFDTLHDLEGTVDPAYRRQPGTGWMFNDTTRKLIRKLREDSTAGTGMYLWEPSQRAGDPDRLLGYPVFINQDLANFATSGATKPIGFGNWRYYIVRDVRDMMMQRLVERYAEEGVYALLAYARIDGRSVLPSTTPARKPYRFLLSST